MDEIDKILKRRGLEYKDLSDAEKETYDDWLRALEKGQLSIDNVRDHITRMKYSVEEELSREPEYKKFLIFKFRNDNNILLKARLRNYLLLEAFLSSPERAKKAIERAVAGMVDKVT